MPEVKYYNLVSNILKNVIGDKIKTKIIPQIAAYLFFFLISSVSNVYPKTYITYNGEEGIPIVSSSAFEKAAEAQKYMDNHDNKVIFNRNLELTLSFVKKCVDEGYLDNKKIEAYAFISNNLRKETENNKIYNVTIATTIEYCTMHAIISFQRQ